MTLATNQQGTPVLHKREFDSLRRLIREHGGIALGENKSAMLRARLGKVLRRHGLETFRAYCRHVTDDTTGEAVQEILDAVATNKTSFFREAEHFALLKRLQPPHATPRIWCAGCATGEEAYTLAMTLAEAPRADILATDLSTKALAVARRGVYSEERLAGIPRAQLRRFFLRGEGAQSGNYKIKPAFASWIRFQRHNLLEPLPGEAPFDAIFCRNVLIYFTRELQLEVVSRFLARLRPGGLLFLGHAESLTNLRSLTLHVEAIAPSAYRLRTP